MNNARITSLNNWQRWAVATALLSPLLIYLSTARSIVAIWNRSETFTHGYIILPISLWLIWRRRSALLQLPVEPYRPALAALLLSGFGWLLAQFAGVNVVMQYALVLMFPCLVLALLGKKIAWSMAFPLFFLVLAVPFGEVFITPLIAFTADFTIAALQLTGIPVLREGSNFSIPSGSWSVVEACSGVRYLISSFTLGCLYAYLTYRSLKKRIVFILFSILVPILANGLRAYMIVMIGHLSGMQLAVGVDHLIYGWLFFGLVMFLMFWLGSYWRDAPEPSHFPANGASGDRRPAAAKQTSVLTGAVLSVLCIGVWPAYAYWIDQGITLAQAPQLDDLPSGWRNVPPTSDWQPAFSAATKEADRSYSSDGKTVSLSLRYYSGRQQEGGLISSSNRLVDSHDVVWSQLSSSSRELTLEGRPLTVRESVLRGRHGYLLVWQWYWIGDRFTASDYQGKLLQAREKLLMRGKDGTAIFVYADFLESPDEARARMQQFTGQHIAALRTTLAAKK